MEFRIVGAVFHRVGPGRPPFYSVSGSTEQSGAFACDLPELRRHRQLGRRACQDQARDCTGSNLTDEDFLSIGECFCWAPEPPPQMVVRTSGLKRSPIWSNEMARSCTRVNGTWGFGRALEKIKEAAEQGVFMFTSDPDDIAVMFDKRACHRRLLKAGIRVSPALGPAESFDEILNEMAKVGWSRVFVKPAHGSSASVVVALERSRGRIQAATSAEIVLENGKDPYFQQPPDVAISERRSTAPADRRAVPPQGTCRAMGPPKRGSMGKTCDLRVLAVNGEPRHMVLAQIPKPNHQSPSVERKGCLMEEYEER